MAEEKKTPEAAQEAPENEPKKKTRKKNAASNAEVERLTAELATLKDAHLRTLAEYDNYRKRSQREKEALYGDAKADTLKLLLPVLDNFDRAAANKTDDIEIYRKGIEMTLSQLGSILDSLGVEAFGEVGDEFDPNIHNAVMSIENPDLPENTIAAVFEKGYKIGDRVLRFATVQVTK